MIKAYLGNVGSGKTLMAVQSILSDSTITYTNIATIGIKHAIRLNKNMLIKETITGVKRNGEPVIKKEFNESFWLETKKKYPKINIILDEAHTLLNSRMSTSKQNIILTNFLALIRKFLGTSNMHGHCILISQLSGRLDIIARDMCSYVQYHLGHFIYKCQICNTKYYSNSEMSLCDVCPGCGSSEVIKVKTSIEIWRFNNMEDFEIWKYTKRKTFFERGIIYNPEKLYNKYDTMQWDSLFD